VSSKTNLPQYVAGQTGYHTDQDGWRNNFP
jgi:hypothetical protein